MDICTADILASFALPVSEVGSPSTRHRLAFVEPQSWRLADVQGTAPKYGLVYHGSDCRLSRVRLSTALSGVKSLMGELLQLQRGEVQPRLVLNDHCPTCEFSTKCHEQAIRGTT
jgi:hypothetical protein